MPEKGMANSNFAYFKLVLCTHSHDCLILEIQVMCYEQNDPNGHGYDIIINRPGVTGPILQIPPLLINRVILCEYIFLTPSLPNHKSQGADVLREGSPPPTCHVSHVTCHLSHVNCHVSLVTCHVTHVFCLFI